MSLLLPTPGVTELACAKCGEPMNLVRVNPRTPAFPTPAVMLWVCPSNPAHRAVPGFENFKQAGA